MTIKLAEEMYNAVAAAVEVTAEQGALGNYLIDSAAWDAITTARMIKASETVTIEHIAGLRKAGKLTRKLARLAKILEREQADWAELDTDLGQ
jgi:hypothetical protein